jgi:hypothetical protein
MLLHVGCCVMHSLQLAPEHWIICRWKRVKQWQPCAIGGLPSSHDPNGVSGPLPQQRVAPSQALTAGVIVEDGQQALSAGTENYFAKFEGSSRPDDVNAASFDQQQQQPSLASQLSGTSPAHVLVW